VNTHQRGRVVRCRCGHRLLVVLLDDEYTARAHARATLLTVQLVADIQAWQERPCPNGAPNAQL